MSQTPYERRLALAAFDARIRDHFRAADTLNKMIAAAAKERYFELGALHATLSPTYRDRDWPVRAMDPNDERLDVVFAAT
jgi:hypothetical protein